MLVTRPITPPWDEASKNFAYYLALHGKKNNYTLLTKKRSLLTTPTAVQQLPIYTQRHLDARQRLMLLKLYSNRNDFDVIHYMQTPNTLNSQAFKVFLRGKKAKTMQTIATLRDDIYSVKDLKKILFANIIVTYSDYAKRKLAAMGFKNAKRIYPGIDLELYKPALRDEEFAKGFGIGKDDFVVTYPGEYVRLGATDDIVDTLPELVKAIPSLKFVFACRVKNKGDAKKKADIIEKISNNRLKQYVVFTDTVSDMPSLFNMSDVVIFPVRDMTGKFDVPLAVVEAMACAKPVIVSDLPVLSEFSTKNNSVIIPVGDNEALLERILYLYHHPEDRLKLGNNARAYTVKHFDITKVAQQYELLYQSLTQKHA